MTVNNSSSLSFYKFVAIYPNGAHTDISTLYRTKTCIGLIPNGSTTVYEDRCFSYSADDSYRLLFFQNDVDVMLDMQAFSRLLLDGIFVYFIPALVCILLFVFFSLCQFRFLIFFSSFYSNNVFFCFLRVLHFSAFPFVLNPKANKPNLSCTPDIVVLHFSLCNLKFVFFQSNNLQLMSIRNSFNINSVLY